MQDAMPDTMTDDEVATDILQNLLGDLESLMTDHKYVTKDRLREVIATYTVEDQPVLVDA